MRVTRKMMVENMVRWMFQKAERIQEAGTVSGSGKKVNRPSDDSMGAGRILADRTTLSRTAQYQSNISRLGNWVEMDNTVLDSVYEILQEVESINMDQAEGGQSIREELTASLEYMYGQVVDLANTRYESGYLYSGDLSSTRPFHNSSLVSGGTAQDLLFDLGDAASSVAIEISDSGGNVVRTLNLTGLSAGAQTVSWDGLDDLGLAVADGEYEYVVTAEDASGDPVAAAHTYRGGAGDKEALIGDGAVLRINNDGGDIFGDVLMSVAGVIASLKADSYDRTAVSQALDHVQTALADLEMEMVDLSGAGTRLENASETRSQTLLLYENKLSDEENCDAGEVAVELQTRETAYEVTLETTALILQMSNLFDRI
ncbi:MAG: hypothetical protein KKB20_25075 [Proteobacteria bacterium]|nr:hypothetical protein [Pseudomonadota bacterium]